MDRDVGFFMQRARMKRKINLNRTFQLWKQFTYWLFHIHHPFIKVCIVLLNLFIFILDDGRILIRNMKSAKARIKINKKDMKDKTLWKKFFFPIFPIPILQEFFFSIKFLYILRKQYRHRSGKSRKSFCKATFHSRLETDWGKKREIFYWYDFVTKEQKDNNKNENNNK